MDGEQQSRLGGRCYIALSSTFPFPRPLWDGRCLPIAGKVIIAASKAFCCRARPLTTTVYVVVSLSSLQVTLNPWTAVEWGCEQGDRFNASLSVGSLDGVKRTRRGRGASQFILRLLTLCRLRDWSHTGNACDDSTSYVIGKLVPVPDFIVIRAV